MKVLKWAKFKLAVTPDSLNLKGLNLANGILTLDWNDKTPTFDFKPHTPDCYYTYVSAAPYNPRCDSTHAQKVLDALSPDEQTIFMRTIAASLDLKTVRKHRGREVRALLMHGTGANGKDTLREAVSVLLGGHGMGG